MSRPPGIEGLLRDAAPQVLGAVVRRFGDFADSEDAVQEALVTAAAQWPAQGTPDNPVGWLVHVASRRMTDRLRSEEAGRRREGLAAPREVPAPDRAPERDDTLALMFNVLPPGAHAGVGDPPVRGTCPPARDGRRAGRCDRRVPGGRRPNHQPARAALPDDAGGPARFTLSRRRRIGGAGTLRSGAAARDDALAIER